MSVRSMILPFLAVLWLCSTSAFAQVEQWESHMDAAATAYQQGILLTSWPSLGTTAPTPVPEPAKSSPGATTTIMSMTEKSDPRPSLASTTTTVFRMKYEVWESSDLQLTFSVVADGYFEWGNINYFDNKPTYLIGRIPSHSISDLIDQIEATEPSLGGADLPTVTFWWTDINGQEKRKRYFLTFQPLVTPPIVGLKLAPVIPLFETIVSLVERYGQTP